jgi:Mg2+-importing ATPase
MTTIEQSFWDRPVSDLFASLKASGEGLNSSEAALRLSVAGPNTATVVKRSPAWARFLRRFQSPLVIILLVASGVSALTGDVTSFVIVVTIVLLSVLMDFVQEWRAESAIDALRNKVALRARVLRDGMVVTLSVSNIVPGDIVDLSAGDLVPADGRVLSARDFFINQALLTGEPYPVEKAAGGLSKATDDFGEATNAAFAGTSVISGSARLLICRTGRRTALGNIADTLIAKPPPTAFETGVHRFGMLILRITVLLVMAVLAESLFFHRPWLQSLMFALALAVGLTPELLPMILTVTLSRGAVRLAAKKVIVKRLAAIHNLGAIDVLCTDKTGTLTQARIELARHVDPKGAESARVFQLAYLNSHFESGLKSALDDAIRAHDAPDVSAWRKIDECPFDFDRRRVSVLAERAGERLLIVKGAPEDILKLSTTFEDGDGKTAPVTEEARAAFTKHFEAMGADGFRALGIATRKVTADHNTAMVTDETELTFAGFAMFLDPPKPSAATAVRALGGAGVAVKILTGDNELVARHICTELDIPIQGVLTGNALAAISDEALLGALPNINLFCRVAPQQKLRILNALKRSGLVVGYIGDGINDAPALHAADVGISIDSATDVAKAAAEIILLEQDLNVLHDGVLEGRRTVVNVNKYILMAGSANFGNIISMVLAGLIVPFLPLLPIQVLLTNLIYDFAQTGLPLDSVDDELIQRPVHWDIRLIERFMMVMGPVSTLFDLITFAVLLLVFHATVGQFRTGWFIESLVTQILMIFMVRTRRWFFASRPSPVVMALAAATALLTLALPFTPVGPLLGFVWPTAAYFVFLAAAVVGFLVVIELVKRSFYRWLPPNHGAPLSAVLDRASGKAN